MKILLLVDFPFFKPAGSSLAVMDILKVLEKMGHEIHILSNPHGSLIQSDKLVHIQIKPRIFKDQGPGEVIKKLVYDHILLVYSIIWVRRVKYDLVIAQGTLYYYFWLIRCFTTAKLIASVHGNLEVEFQKWGVTESKLLLKLAESVEKSLLKSADFLICIHESVKEKLSNAVKLRGKLHFIPMTSSKAKIKTSKTSVDFVCLYTGTFVEVQNLDLLIDAAGLTMGKCHIKLVGATEAELELWKNRISVRNIANVEVFGKFSADDLEPFYREADVVLSPRVFGHDTPTKIIDYLALGKCIVATDMPIHTGVLDNSVAVLVKPSASDFAEALLSLRKDRDLIRNYEAKAREHFEKNFSPEVVYAKYNDLFMTAVKSHDSESVIH